MFNLSCLADIQKVTIDRGKSDDAIPSVKIKLKVEDVSAKTVAAALGAESADDVVNGLFRAEIHDVDQGALFMHLKRIESKVYWEGKHMLTFKGFRPMRCSKVGDISVVPRGKLRSDVVFSVRIEKPLPKFLDSLSEMIHHPTAITIEQDAELELVGGANGRPAPVAGKQSDLSLDAQAVDNSRTAAFAALKRKPKAKPKNVKYSRKPKKAA